MVLTPSTMVGLGSACPDFALPDLDGATVSRHHFEGKPLLVAFICNHCPYVKHIADGLATKTTEWSNSGVGVVLINSNDVENYPEDHPDRMLEEAQHRGYTVPYLFDASQDVARAFHAACTPDFFLYDAAHQLAYRGQLDAARPGNGVPVTGASLDAAIRAVQAGEPVGEQVPSIGCNIKWKP